MTTTEVARCQHCDHPVVWSRTPLDAYDERALFASFVHTATNRIACATPATAVRWNPPRGFHEQADGSLVCPHRDVSVCAACVAVHVEIVDVVGAHFWVAEESERREMADW